MLSGEDLVEYREKSTPELPSFGIKDFEPDGSSEQLHDINCCLNEIKQVIAHNRVKMIGSLSQAVWQPELGLAKVVRQTGPYWTTMGHTINKELYIYPEEALYLLEIGALELAYNDVSLSVQRAYSLLLEQQPNITVEKYRVYSHLNAHGLKVMRHSPFKTVTKYEKQLEVHKLHLKLKKYNSNIHREKRNLELCDKTTEMKKKFKYDEIESFPLNIKEGSHKEMCKKMQLFKPYENNSQSTLNFDYDVYLETSAKQSFKKSCFQLPNFRITVHRCDDPMPSLKEICRLSTILSDAVPVIQAIVFPDYIAFYEINPVILPDVCD